MLGHALHALGNLGSCSSMQLRPELGAYQAELSKELAAKKAAAKGAKKRAAASKI